MKKLKKFIETEKVTFLQEELNYNLLMHNQLMRFGQTPLF